MAASAVILIVLFAAALFSTAQRYRIDQQWTLHTYQVRERILLAIGDARDAEMQARSYGLTGRDAALQQYWHAISALDRDIDDIGDLVADSPVQAAAVKQLREAIVARRNRLEQIINDYRSNGPAVAHADVIALIAHPANPVREVAIGMLDHETALLKSRAIASARNSRNVAIAAAVALGGSLALLIAALASAGLEQRRRVRSERNLEESARRLEQALHEASHAGETLHRLARLTELLQNCRDLNEAINVIERALPPLLAETSGSLALINASRNIVESRMHWGERGPELADAVFTPDDCWALRRSQPHPGMGDTTAPVCAHLVQTGIAASHTLCLPLSSQGQSLGLLSLSTPAPILSDMRQLATTVADQLALALGNLQLQASLRIQSIRDPLTNLFNRRYLEASIPRELVRAERRQGGLSVLMLDLDHFKRYNDAQGHGAGDALLSAFGSLLARSCRHEDLPCRFGGEEFTLVLSDTDHAHALERAEAIRAATAELVVPYHSGSLPPATVSIGVASHPEHGETPEALLRMADQALYRAKQLGRNRVVSAADVVHALPEPQPAIHRT